MPDMPRRNSKTRGFSLIEVMAAITILVLSLEGALNIFEQGFAAARKIQQQVVAGNLARAAAEEYSAWVKVATNSTDTLAAVNLNNISYSRQARISDGPVFPNQLKRLDITISWIDGGISRILTISTLKANY